jgi:hypothetical protein
MTRLREGDRVSVGVPPMTVYVAKSAAWRSRSRSAAGAVLAQLSMLPLGRPVLGAAGDDAAVINPYDSPLTLVLRYRPYPFLAAGDVVVDAAGTRLRFQPPVLFLAPDVTFEDGPDDLPPSQVPRWPLTLVERNGGPAAVEAAQSVARETSAGCHDGILDQWEAQSGVRLPAEDVLPAWFVLRLPPGVTH